MTTMQWLTARARARFGAVGFALTVAISVFAALAAQAQETVPRTFDGAGDAFKRGGKEIGAGFRGVGRGVKDTFTGQRSAEDYRQGKQIGTGFKDIGRGIAGGGRATGREIKKGVTGSGDERD